MESIPLPNLKTIKEDSQKGIFEIAPLYPGYGPTIANALRRVLLTSLTGAAADNVKIEDVDHEFSTIKGVKEDVVEIILNLKSLRVRLFGEDDKQTLTLENKTEGEVTAKDFEFHSNVEILNQDHKIATVDKNGKLNMTVTFSKGRGFMASEEKKQEREIGVIVVDSFYSPVRHVSFEIENTRVGQATNYDKIILTVETDGSIQPRQAIQESARVLTEHYALIASINAVETINQVKEQLEKKIEEIKENNNYEEVKNDFKDDSPLDPKVKIDDLEISGRAKNALISAGYKTLSGLKRLSEIKLAGIKGLGVKGLEEVSSLLARIED